MCFISQIAPCRAKRKEAQQGWGRLESAKRLGAALAATQADAAAAEARAQQAEAAAAEAESAAAFECGVLRRRLAEQRQAAEADRQVRHRRLSYEQLPHIRKMQTTRPLFSLLVRVCLGERQACVDRHAYCLRQ